MGGDRTAAFDPTSDVYRYGPLAAHGTAVASRGGRWRGKSGHARIHIPGGATVAGLGTSDVHEAFGTPPIRRRAVKR
ncbi:MAG TPA: hypothetical protein VLV78_14010 [Thermoanaerobaculia bacterium]|nr:hypothetical protein [Thermoanaerobaculia bacterium]